MVNVPAPETEGLKLLPLTPVPEKVPPEGVPVRLTELMLIQTVLVATFMFTVGRGLMVTVAVLLPCALHPGKSPVTVYVVVVDGDTAMLVVFEPVFQVYVLAPLAVSVADEPVHTDTEFTVITGAVPTVKLEALESLVVFRSVLLFGALVHTEKV